MHHRMLSGLFAVSIVCAACTLGAVGCAAQCLPLPLFVERAKRIPKLPQQQAKEEISALLDDLLAEPTPEAQTEKLDALTKDHMAQMIVCMRSAEVFPKLREYQAREIVLALVSEHYDGCRPPRCEEGEAKFAQLLTDLASTPFAELDKGLLPAVQLQIVTYFSRRWECLHDEVALEGIFRMALVNPKSSPDAPGWTPTVDEVLTLPHPPPGLLKNLESKLRILEERAKDPLEKKDLHKNIERLRKAQK